MYGAKVQTVHALVPDTSIGCSSWRYLCLDIAFASRERQAKRKSTAIDLPMIDLATENNGELFSSMSYDVRFSNAPHADISTDCMHHLSRIAIGPLMQESEGSLMEKAKIGELSW